MDDGCWTATHAILVTVRISVILALAQESNFIRKKTSQNRTSIDFKFVNQHFPEEKPNETHLSSNRSLFFFAAALAVNVGENPFSPGLPHFKLLCVMPGSPTFSGTGQVQLPYREATPKICLQETGCWPGNWRFLQGVESSHEDPCRFEGWKIPDFSIGHIYVDLFMVHFSAIAVWSFASITRACWPLVLSSVAGYPIRHLFEKPWSLCWHFGCFSNGRKRRNQTHRPMPRAMEEHPFTSWMQCPSMNQKGRALGEVVPHPWKKSNLSGNVAKLLFRIACWDDAPLKLIFKRWQPVCFLSFASGEIIQMICLWQNDSKQVKGHLATLPGFQKLPCSPPTRKINKPMLNKPCHFPPCFSIVPHF